MNKKLPKKSAKPKAAKAGKKLRRPKGSELRPRASEEKPIGAVTHYYSDLGVAIVKFNKAVKSGTKLKFKGATTDFEETVQSMQYDHKPIDTAPKGKQVGIKVGSKVREGDEVFSA